MPARYSMLLITASSLALGLLLGACQPRATTGTTTGTTTPSPTNLTPADPEPDATQGATMLAPEAPVTGIPDAFAGRWFVSAVFPTGANRASTGDLHLGVSLVIGGDEVSDVNGQRCVAPSIGIAHDQHNLSLGSLDMADLSRLTITCKNAPFASYLLLPGSALDASYQAAGAPDVPHALVADRPEGRYLLERAEHILLRQASIPAALAGEGKIAPAPATSTPVTVPAVPAKPVVPETSSAPAPAPALGAPLVLAPALPEPEAKAPEATAPAEPATKAPVAEAPVTATADSKLPAPGAAIHLASYSGISAAKRGWKILLGDFDALDPLSPLYVTVDVPQKGKMVRLYATGDAAGLGQACTALRAKGAYCEPSR